MASSFQQGAKFLGPLGSLYGKIVSFVRSRSSPVKLPIPVICVGNVVMGGAGKTPIALMIAHELQARGKIVHFVTRGYGGKLKGPIKVQNHTFQEVGDEPLILAKVAPTWVAPNRRLAGMAAAKNGAEVLIMDDGHQNGMILKDLSLLVIDTEYGFGNGKIFPAGPLREDLAQGYARTQGIVLIGDHPSPTSVPLSLPSIRVKFLPLEEDMKPFYDKSLILFAGIGRPDKFFNMVERYQKAYHFTILEKISYSDHYVYTPRDYIKLQKKALRAGALLVTTEKDFVKCQALKDLFRIRLAPRIIEG